MPLAMARKAKAAQAAGEKPRVRPYHGTRIAAAANVSANISAFVQTKGGVCSLRIVSDMRVNLSRRGSRGGTYVVFEYAAPVRHLWELDSMTWIPMRSGALRGSLAASLALVAWLALPAGARAGRAYVSNEDDGTVTVIDTQRLAAIGTIAVGKRPRGLVLSHDGARLYVAVSGLPKCPPPIPEEKCAKLPRDLQADGVAVIDTATLKQTRMLKGVSDPERVEISRDGHSLFVTDEDAARLSVLDVVRGSVVAKIPVGRE